MQSDHNTPDLIVAPWCDESGGFPVMRGDYCVATFAKADDAESYLSQARKIAELERAMHLQRNAALALADAAHKTSRVEMDVARRMRAESNPDALESERAMNAQLTAELNQAADERADIARALREAGYVGIDPVAGIKNLRALLDAKLAVVPPSNDRAELFEAIRKLRHFAACVGDNPAVWGRKEANEVLRMTDKYECDGIQPLHEPPKTCEHDWLMSESKDTGYCTKCRADRSEVETEGGQS